MARGLWYLAFPCELGYLGLHVERLGSAVWLACHGQPGHHEPRSWSLRTDAGILGTHRATCENHQNHGLASLSCKLRIGDEVELRLCLLSLLEFHIYEAASRRPTIFARATRVVVVLGVVLGCSWNTLLSEVWRSAHHVAS